MGQANFDIDAVNAELQIAAQEDREKSAAEMELDLLGLLAGGDWVGDIYDMHTKFSVRDVIEKLDAEKKLKFLEFRLNFLQEELDEAKAAHARLVAGTGDKVEAADDVVDAMIDLCVVAIGTLDAFQVDAYEAWDRVHDKNMQKEPGIKPERPNPLGLPDLIKPAGWTPPSHSDNIGLFATL